MALGINKTASFGGVVAYWRLDEIKISPRHQTATIQLGGYLDAATAGTGATPAVRMTIEVPYSEFSALPAYDNLTRQIYRYIKTLPEWAAALDV